MLRRSLVLLLALFFVACGGDTVVTQGNAPAPAGPVGNIEVQFLLQNRAVPPSITEFRFSGLDAAGSYSFGPVTRPRAGQVLLSNVPTSTVQLQIEYLENGVLKGIGLTSVVVPANGTVQVIDPDFVDVGEVVERLEVTPVTARVPAGVEVDLQATAVFFDGTTRDVTSAVTWISSNPAVAQVGAAPGSFGVATTLTPGTTNLTAQLGDLSDQMSLTVTNATLVLLLVEPNNPVIGPGKFQVRAVGLFSDGSNHDLTDQVNWTSSVPAVASIDSSTGLVTGLSAGSTTLTATEPVSGLTDDTLLTVTAATLTRLVVEPSSGTRPVGLSQQFDVIGFYNDGTTQVLTSSATWSSSDEAVATVGNASGNFGRAAALAPGQTTLTATFQGVSDTGLFTVTTAEVESLAIEPAQLSLPLGLPGQLKALATLTDGTVIEVTDLVTWSVADPSVAEVSNAPGLQGEVSTLGFGTTAVTATIPGGVQAQGSISVIQAALEQIEIEPGPTDTLPVGECCIYVALGTFSDGQVRDISGLVTWTSSDETVASVGNFFPVEGLVFAEGLGTATITATDPFTGLSAGTTLTVTPAVLVDLFIEPETSSVEPLGTVQLTATGVFSDGSTEDLTHAVFWSSQDDFQVFVFNFPGLEGLALGLLPGGAVVSALHESGLEASAVVNVDL